ARAARPLLRELLRLSPGTPARSPAREWPLRRARSLRGGTRLLRRGPGRDPRADQSRRSADVPRRAPDEAGPDEHGGVDREPGAVPRPPLRRAHRGDAGLAEAPGRTDEGGPARGAPRRGAPGHSHAAKDGLPRAPRPLVLR